MKKQNQEKAIVSAFPAASFDAKDVALTALLIIASALVPAILGHTPHNQIITGTLVNLLLFFSAYRLGIANAGLVAIVPSSIALASGLLSPAMAAALPFIILANLLLILVFSAMKKFPLAGILFASFAKYIALFSAVSLLFGKVPLAAQMFGIMQLATALFGGVLAYAIIQLTDRTPSRRNK